MKIFFCMVIVMLVVVLSGCQIPVDKIIDTEPPKDTVDMNTNELQKKDDLNNESKSVGSNNTQISGIDENSQDSKDIKDSKNNKIAKEASTTDSTSQMLELIIYYKDAEGVLIPITRRIIKEEGVAKAALKSMVDNDINKNQIKAFGLSPVLPEGTEVLGMSIKEGNATVDFNERILDYEDEKSEQNIISSIVYTLTEFKTISVVKILINGKEEKALKYGTDISGTFSRKNLLINSKKINLKDKIKKVDVYLFKSIGEKFDYILPISMEYIGVEEEDLPKEIIGLFSRKYDDDKLYSLVPSKTQLLESRIIDKVLILNFNSEIKNYGGGTAKETGIMKQLLYSMKQIDGIEKVKILIEGKVGYLPEGTDISKELLLPEGINCANG